MVSLMGLSLTSRSPQARATPPTSSGGAARGWILAVGTAAATLLAIALVERSAGPLGGAGLRVAVWSLFAAATLAAPLLGTVAPGTSLPRALIACHLGTALSVATWSALASLFYDEHAWRAAEAPPIGLVTYLPAFVVLAVWPVGPVLITRMPWRGAIGTAASVLVLTGVVAAVAVVTSVALQSPR